MHRFTQVFYSLGFGARCSQDGPKRLQDAPRCSKMGPRCSQDGPKMPQEAPKMGPRGPKMLQDGPKVRQDEPKIFPRSPKMLPRWPQEAPRCLCGVFARSLCSIFGCVVSQLGLQKTRAKTGATKGRRGPSFRAHFKHPTRGRAPGANTRHNTHAAHSTSHSTSHSHLAFKIRDWNLLGSKLGGKQGPSCTVLEARPT